MAHVKIKDPTGKLWRLPETVATGLAGGADSKWELVADEPDPETGGTAEPPFPDGDPVYKWTVPQLVAWAEAHGVDLGEAKKKDDVWAVVEASRGTRTTGATASASDDATNHNDVADVTN